MLLLFSSALKINLEYMNCYLFTNVKIMVPLYIIDIYKCVS